LQSFKKEFGILIASIACLKRTLLRSPYLRGLPSNQHCALLKKLKQNYKFIALAALLILPAFFGLSRVAFAANIVAKSIEVKTEIQVTNPDGSVAADNFIRAVEGEPAKVTVIMTITKATDRGQNAPASILVPGTDTLHFEAKDLTGDWGTVPLVSFGGGLEPAGPGNTCVNKGIGGPIGLLVPFFAENTSYVSCKFVGGNQSISSTQLEVNKPYAVTYTIDSSNLARLFLNRPCAREGVKTEARCFTVYPYINIQVSGSVYPVAVSSAGKDIFVQYYKTDADLQQALLNKERPAGIPAYGSNQGDSGLKNEGSKIFGLINTIIGAIIGLIQEFIYIVFYWLLAPMIQAMLSIHTYTDTFAAVIYPAWLIVRNICNILFIISIIAIGLGTLFRLDSYEYKHLLVQLIIAALMVNFSLVIAQAILGLADTVQNQFLPNNVEVIRSLAKDLMLGYRDVVYNADFASRGYFSSTVKPLFYLSLAMGSFAVFAAIAVLLVIRIVMLWVLLMLSPIPYIAGVLPATAKYSSQWWDNFIKYAFFTPIMAFFLNVAALVSNAQKDNPIFKTISSDDLGGSDLAVFVFKVASNIILLVFLVAGLQVAEQLGIYGAQAVSEIGKKGLFSPFAAAGGLAGKGSSYAGRKWNEFTANKIRGKDRKVSLGRAIGFAALNPVAFAKGWSKKSEEKQHRAQAEAEAAGLEVVEQRFDSVKSFREGGYKILPHMLQHDKEEEDERSKKLQNLSRENVARTAHEYFMMGDDKDSMAYKRGIIKLAMSKGYIDDIVTESHNTDEGKKMMASMEALTDNSGHKILQADDFAMYDEKDKNGALTGRQVRGLVYNNRTRQSMYKAMFGTNSHGHLKDHAAMRLITEEGEKEGMDTGHLEYMTDMYFNVKTGSYEWYAMNADGSSEGDSAMAAGEIAKKDSRTQSKIAWHSLMGSNGKNFNKAVYTKVSKAISENPSFMQERTSNMLIAGTTDSDKIKAIIDKYNDTGILEVDDVSAERIKQMGEVDEAATAAVFQRFLNEAKGPNFIEKRLKEGIKIQVTGGSRADINFKKGNSDKASINSIKNLTANLDSLNVSQQNVGISRVVLDSFDSSPAIPEFNSVVSAVEGSGVNKTESIKISSQYIQDSASTRVNKADVVNDGALGSHSTQYSAVVVPALSPQALGKFTDITKDGIRKGLIDASKHVATDVTARKLAIKNALDKVIVGNKKDLDNVDLIASGFNTTAFVDNIYGKIQ